MRQVSRKGLMYVAAGGVLAVTGGTAHADSGAEGAANSSPGVLSGNTVQVPIEVPINICGNTATLVGGLNPVSGVECVNDSGTHRPVEPEKERETPEGERETPAEVDEPTPPVSEEEAPDEDVRQAVSLPVDSAEEAPELAETGGGAPAGLVVPLAGGLVLGGGALLYRRSRMAQRA